MSENSKKLASILKDAAKQATPVVKEMVKDAATATGEKINTGVKYAKENIPKAAKEVSETIKTKAEEVSDGAKKLINDFEEQKKQYAETEYSDKAMEVCLSLINKLYSAPVVRVDREEFLYKLFGKSEHWETILEKGPQYVFSYDTLRKYADETIKNSTRKTTVASFVAGLPSTIATSVITATADIVQFFGFALNLAQKLSYLYGEDELFNVEKKTDGDLVHNDGTAVPEEAQVKMVGYLGAMLGVSGAGSLIIQASKNIGTQVGKKVAAQALTKTAWYPAFKKVASNLGINITKQSVNGIIKNSVPVIGSAVSSVITYVTFKPMGGKLVDVLEKLNKGEYDIGDELNEAFAAELKQKEEFESDVIDAEWSVKE